MQTKYVDEGTDMHVIDSVAILYIEKFDIKYVI